jgi:hypothetical protein
MTMGDRRDWGSIYTPRLTAQRKQTFGATGSVLTEAFLRPSRFLFKIKFVCAGDGRWRARTLEFVNAHVHRPPGRHKEER